MIVRIINIINIGISNILFLIMNIKHCKIIELVREPQRINTLTKLCDEKTIEITVMKVKVGSGVGGMVFNYVSVSCSVGGSMGGLSLIILNHCRLLDNIT